MEYPDEGSDALAALVASSRAQRSQLYFAISNFVKVGSGIIIEHMVNDK